MTGMTRGRLPARVYWVRRLMVLGTAVLLVVGIARLLGGSSDGSSGPDRATRVSDTQPTLGASGTSGTGVHHRSHPTATATPLAQPSGPCAPGDIAITPSVPHPIAGRDIALDLYVSTVTSPACDWTVSARTLAVTITSGSDSIWSSVECGRMITRRDVVLRRDQPTKVALTWNARRSEPGCPRLTAWALPGTYHLHVAALAGHPQDLTFLLVAPTPADVTRTAHPKQQHPKKQHPAG